MIIKSEIKDGRKTNYISTVVDEDSGEIIAQRTVKCPLYQIEKDDFVYFLLYDDNMNPISEVYDYLNFELSASPLTTRRMVANALRLLYCFLSLSGCSITEIDERIFGEFIYFIRGKDINPKEFSLKTQRSNATVNSYFAFYREFFRYMNVDCPPLFRSHNIYTNRDLNDFSSRKEKIKYDTNLKKNSYTDRYVPKYISPEEFKKLYSEAKAQQDKQAEIIMHLMYGYGLRLGEVLGLTIEDFDEITESETLVPVLWLRNRMSDKPFQYAKGQPHVSSKKQYQSKEYKNAKSKIILTYEFYEQLLEFVGMVREVIETKYPNIKDRAVADIVSTNNDLKENYYIFLNSYGKVLSEQVWNKKLRKYFKKCGVHVDTGGRDNNLSHRFRHGFAMFHARFSEHPVGELELQKLMRHRSLLSTMVYYNLTPKDELEIKNEFQEELYKTLPMLLKE